MSVGEAGEVLRPEGALTMMTVPAMLADARRLAAAGDLALDLSAVGEADSAALALMLDCLRSARAASHRFEVRNLPQGLASLASLYGIDALLADAGVSR